MSMLMLAYPLTMHRAQGMTSELQASTLKMVLKKRVDMSRVLLLARCTQHSAGVESFDILNSQLSQHEHTKGC